ncbi:MAG: lipopolysaccharide biosynthesis protein [Bacteroidales bacterium]|nr:lipopolysaccharide biosynthesis protein [Bacteroidales bacterium]
MQNILFRFKQLKGTLAFFSSEGLAKGLHWVLLLLLFFLSKPHPENYGMLALLIAFERMAEVMLDFGQKRVVYRFFDKSTHDNRYFLSTTFTAWMLLIAVILLSLGLGIWASGCDTFFNIKTSLPLYICMANLGVGKVYAFVTYILRIDKRIKSYAGMRLIFSIVQFAASLLVSIVFDDVSLGFVLGTFLAYVISTICKIGVFKEFAISFLFDWNIFKRNMLYGYPLVIQQLISNIGPNIDKFFLAELVSLTEVGHYNFVVTILSAFTFLFSICTSYFEPMLFKIRKDPKRFLITNQTFIYTCIGFAAVVVLATSGVFQLIDKAGETPLYLMLSAAYIMLPVYFYNTYVYMTSDKNGYVVFFSAIAVLADLAANYILIKSYGVMGAAMAQCIYTFVLSWLSYAFMEWKYPHYRSNHNRLLGIIMTLPVVACFVLNAPLVLLAEYLAITFFASYFITKNRHEMFAVVED